MIDISNWVDEAVELFNAWVDEVVELFNTDYGTTSFFSNAYTAQNWVENNFLNNPRLTPLTKIILLDNSNVSLTLAFQQASEPQLQAVLYWQYMGDFIALNTYDAKLIAMFSQGVAAAQDTHNLTYDEEVEDTYKFPIWLLIFPFFFFLGRK